MQLPSGVQFVLQRLRGQGHTACPVGGCVRDALLGRPVHDWDICTSATPEQTAAAFPDCRIVLTGAAHGTVTVLVEGQPFEVTTYRVEGDYTDHRHPGRVAFVPQIEQDLARRDFTINAMALGADGAIVDLFGGQSDLAAGVIRCVGEPRQRFAEDALRILRALRFASQLNFVLDPATDAAVRADCDTLRSISAERVYAELCKLLCGPGAARVLAGWPEVFGVILPELLPCVGFDQHSPHHVYDVWNHICVAVGYAQPILPLRWALLLHDISKPNLLTLDDRGRGHFYGHPRQSARIARTVLTRLRADRATRELVETLVLHHDDHYSLTPRGARHQLAELGPETVRLLCLEKYADLAAHTQNERILQHVQEIRRFEALVEAELEKQSCYTLKDLALTGSDVLAAGIPAGPRVGSALRYLLRGVIDGAWPNDRAILLQKLAAYCATSWETRDL